MRLGGSSVLNRANDLRDVVTPCMTESSRVIDYVNDTATAKRPQSKLYYLQS